MKKKNITIEQLIKLFLKFLFNYKIGKRSTRKTRNDTLNHKYNNINVIMLFAGCGIKGTKDINPTRLKKLNALIDNSTIALNTKTKIKASIVAMFQFGIDENYLENNRSMLRVLKQKQQIPEEVILPTKKQLETLQSLSKTLLNEDTLWSLMAWIMIIFCCLVNAIRPGEEVVNINVEDLDLDEGKIRVHRKGGKLQWINFPLKYIPILQRFLVLREEYLRSKGSPNEQALFIKRNQNMGTHGRRKSCWRLKTGGFWRIFRVLRKGTNIEKIKPYTLRHYSCSSMVLNAKIFDIKMEQIASRNDHSLIVLENHYDGALGNHHELYMREQHENIEFIKGMINKTMTNLLNNPSKIEYLFSAIEWAKDLGKTQKAIELSEYTDRKKRNLNLDIGDIERGIQYIMNDFRVTTEVRTALPGLLSLIKQSPEQSINGSISSPQKKSSLNRQGKKKKIRL